MQDKRSIQPGVRESTLISGRRSGQINRLYFPSLNLRFPSKRLTTLLPSGCFLSCEMSRLQIVKANVSEVRLNVIYYVPRTVL